MPTTPNTAFLSKRAADDDPNDEGFGNYFYSEVGSHKYYKAVGY